MTPKGVDFSVSLLSQDEVSTPYHLARVIVPHYIHHDRLLCSVPRKPAQLVQPCLQLVQETIVGNSEACEVYTS